MRTHIDAAAYLDGLSILSRRGFSSIQEATEAILQLVTEQLRMRSSFLTRIAAEASQFQVVAAHNEPGGCDIQIGAVDPLTESFQSMMNKADGPSPLVLEDLRSDALFASRLAPVALSRMGSYIGVPVVLSDGTVFGTLGTIDPLARPLSLMQARLLVVLARLLATQFERDQQLVERKWAETELSRALISLQESNEQREYMNRMQSDFVSIVNHEFRTTLTGIQGFSELMRDEEFGFQEIKEFASDINADARRLSHLINQLLDLDQMKSGQTVLRLEEIDLNVVIVTVAEEIGPGTPAHQIRLQLDRTLPLLISDRNKLAHVVSNLLNNAIKYSPAGGEILLSSRVDGEFVHVRVQDHGVGISPHALEQVFDPYYSRVQSAASLSPAQDSRYVKGTGLGLPIVRQIIQMHGGKVWAESVPGQGSVFHFTIPLAGIPTIMEENNG